MYYIKMPDRNRATLCPFDKLRVFNPSTLRQAQGLQRCFRRRPKASTFAKGYGGQDGGTSRTYSPSTSLRICNKLKDLEPADFPRNWLQKYYRMRIPWQNPSNFTKKLILSETSPQTFNLQEEAMKRAFKKGPITKPLMGFCTLWRLSHFLSSIRPKTQNRQRI